MSILLEIPKIHKLDCGSDGKISKKDLDAYFKNIGRTMGRLSLSANGLSLDDKCGIAITAAIVAIDEIVKIIEGITTDPLGQIKSKELELKYRARELGKDIEEFFKKKIVDILLELIGILGIPNPFMIPIPFIGTAILIDIDGSSYEYDPVIADLFTKSGQRKVKLAIKNDIEEVKKFLGIESTYDGSLGIKSPDLEVEETWHKVKNWFSQLINDFIGSIAEAIANVIKSIPIIGKPIYTLVMASIDPTITVEEAFDILVAEYKAKIKQAKEDVLSGKALEDLGEELMQEAIDKILGIQIPLLGTVGDLLGIDPNTTDIRMKAMVFHDIEDAFKEFIQKARRFFRGGIIIKINEILVKAPGYILKQFPIVGKILKIISQVADFLSGKNPLTECDVLNVILPPIFNMSFLIEAALPSCVEVRYIE
jgi:hypothetical protein